MYNRRAIKQAREVGLDDISKNIRFKKDQKC